MLYLDIFDLGLFALILKDATLATFENGKLLVYRFEYASIGRRPSALLHNLLRLCSADIVHICLFNYGIAYHDI